MFTRARKLLLRIRKGNGKAADPVPRFALLLFLHPRALYTQSAALLRSVESQLHCPAEQIGENVLRFLNLLIVLGPLRLQSAEMQRHLVFGALLRRQLLVPNEILSRPIYIAHGFVEQSKFPFGKSEFRSQLAGLIEICKRAIILAFRE